MFMNRSSLQRGLEMFPRMPGNGDVLGPHKAWKGNWHALIARYGSVHLDVLSHLILALTLWGYCETNLITHFINEEMEGWPNSSPLQCHSWALNPSPWDAMFFPSMTSGCLYSKSWGGWGGRVQKWAGCVSSTTGPDRLSWTNLHLRNHVGL